MNYLVNLVPLIILKYYDNQTKKAKNFWKFKTKPFMVITLFFPVFNPAISKIFPVSEKTF
jgi:hypothetical protein